MTIEEKVNYMRIMGNIGSDVEDNLLMAYLDLAKQKIIDHVYPFKNNVVELESKYDMKQVELAIILFDKRGAEGEEHHNENGVNRKYQSEEKFFASLPRSAGIPK